VKVAGDPVHTPCVTVSVSPWWALPEIVGGDVFTGLVLVAVPWPMSTLPWLSTAAHRAVDETAQDTSLKGAPAASIGVVVQSDALLPVGSVA
jgi:hypothetical protein